MSFAAHKSCVFKDVFTTGAILQNNIEINNELEVFVPILKTDVGFCNNRGRRLLILLSRCLFTNNNLQRRHLIG